MSVKKFKCPSCGNKTVGVMTDQDSISCPKCGSPMIVVEVVRP